MMLSFLKRICFLLFLYTGHWCMAQQIPYAAWDFYGKEPQAFSRQYLEQPQGKQATGRDTAFIERLLKRGEQLEHNGMYEEAMALYRHMQAYNLPVAPWRMRVYGQMASLLHRKGHYQEALRMHYYALERAASKRDQAKLYINISGLYRDLKYYDHALQSLDTALALSKHSAYWTAIALSNKGAMYNARSRYSRAIEEFLSAYKVAEQGVGPAYAGRPSDLGMPDVRTLILNNLADSYLKQGMTDSALYYLHLVLSDVQDLSQYSRCFVLTTLGQVYLQKGMDREAKYYMEQGLKIAQRSGYQMLAIEAHQSMAALNGRMGDYKAAWEQEKAYSQIRDSLISNENIQKINTLQRQYDVSRRDRELAQQELLISKQASRLKERDWVSSVLILVVASLVIIFLMLRRNQRNKHKLLEEQLNNTVKDRKILQIEAGMKGEEKERARIARDLHDGVVSEMLAMKLNLQAMGRSRQELRQSDDYRIVLYQAEEVTEKLRMAAHNLMPVNLQQLGLLQTIQTFLDRIINQHVHFSFQHYGEVPDLNKEAEKILLMMVMELIQNILKHARATEAIIQFDFFEDSMSITVEDNGVGMAAGGSIFKGMGLTNIENNVQILNGSMDIRSSEFTGTTMLIEIPLNEHTLQRPSPAEHGLT